METVTISKDTKLFLNKSDAQLTLDKKWQNSMADIAIVDREMKMYRKKWYEAVAIETDEGMRWILCNEVGVHALP